MNRFLSLARKARMSKPERPNRERGRSSMSREAVSSKIVGRITLVTRMTCKAGRIRSLLRSNPGDKIMRWKLFGPKDASNPFEKGDPLRNENFDQWWFEFFVAAIAILLCLAGLAWVLLQHHVFR